MNELITRLANCRDARAECSEKQVIKDAMKTIQILLGVAVASALAGCSSVPLVLDPVGPAPNRAATTPADGHLVVYTATETRPLADSTFYYPHSAYHIYAASGKLWKYVPNHIGDMDQSPSLVAIPAGSYTLLAESDSYGRVTVPVVIKPGRTTEVNLETRGRRKTDGTNETSVVRLPNGYIVGWRVP